MERPRLPLSPVLPCEIWGSTLFTPTGHSHFIGAGSAVRATYPVQTPKPTAARNMGPGRTVPGLSGSEGTSHALTPNRALGQLGTDPLLWASLHLADQELQRRLTSGTPTSMLPSSLVRSLLAPSELAWTWARTHGHGGAPGPGNPKCQKQPESPTRWDWLTRCRAWGLKMLHSYKNAIASGDAFQFCPFTLCELLMTMHMYHFSLKSNLKLKKRNVRSLWEWCGKCTGRGQDLRLGDQFVLSAIVQERGGILSEWWQRGEEGG